MHVEVGALVDGRFRVIAVAGQGGFGTVFRAIDTSTARDVALKVFPRAQTDFARFEREAEVLATIRHRHVVAYVGHGLTEEGAPYLAMEWLDGVDLADRVARGPMTLEHALTVTLRAAQGLAAAHALGIVHRDVKPSNLLLVGDQPEETRLIDFGVARARESFAKLTATGTVLGTPQYMAPEQARGQKQLTPRVDVFALGAVLFECLTGAPAFDGPNAHAILAKILSAATPRLADRRPDLPAVVEMLLARMLAHDPTDRLPDGAAAASAISGLLSDGKRISDALRAPAPVLERPLRGHASVLVRAAEAHPLPADAARAAAELGGDVHARDDRALVASFGADGTHEATRRAAEYALRARGLDATLAIAIVTMRRETLVVEPEAVETELERLDAAPIAGAIVLDDASARHLAATFDVVRSGTSSILVGRRDAEPTTSRALLGRARELAVIGGAFASAVEDLRAQIVLVLGEPGLGKSRLVEESARRLALLPEAPRVLFARGDRPTSTSPFGAAAQLVRERVGADGEVARARLRAALLADGVDELAAEFACELAGLHAKDVDAPHLAAARRDPIILADAYRASWLSYLEAQLDERPLVLVVDDIHLVDPASIHLLDVALEQLADRWLLVLGTARPEEGAEVLSAFAAREPERVSLRALRPHLAREIVRAGLPDAAPQAVDAIVQRAGGNPLNLGELARLGVTDGASAESLAAAIEARLSRLEPGVQRVLRAASVFGIRFPSAGLVALFGGDERSAYVAAALRTAERERFVSRVDRAAGDVTWSFANALLQETIYAMLPPQERRDAHAAIARLLERRSAIDPSLVAWHFERAEETDVALAWYAAAARAALDGRHLDRALALTDRALACRPAGQDLSRVLLVRAEAAFLRTDAREGKDAAERAMGAARPGSLEWLGAAGLLITSAGQLGDNVELRSHAERVRREAAEASAGGVRAVCLCRAASQLFVVGEHSAARELMDEADRTSGDDPLARAWIARLRAAFHLVDDVYEPAIEAYGEAVRLHAAAGDARGACQARILKASFHVFAADFEGAESELGVAESIAWRTGADYFTRWAGYTRGKILALSADAPTAREHLERVRADLAKSPRIVAGAHIYLGLAALRASDAPWAEREARASLDAHGAPTTRAQALAVLARALVRSGRSDEARDAADQAWEILRAVGRVEENESVVHLARVEALAAAGDDAAARSAAEIATRRLLRIAKGLATPARRESYLERVESHAETMRIAHRLGVAVHGD